MACKRFFHLYLLLHVSVAFSQIDGKLIIHPRDTVSKVNQSTYFNCSTTLKSDEIFWLHGQNYVYAGNKILKPYDARFRAERYNGSCNLVIQSVEPGDAGEYSCTEKRFEEKPSAQLIVIDDDPLFQSNMKLDEVIGPNMCNMKKVELKLSCSVTFHGNRPPALEWMKVGSDNAITEYLSIAVSGNTYNITLKLKGDTALHKSAYVCQVTETTQSPYKCNSGIINVLFSDDPEEHNMNTEESVTCFSNNTFFCSYLWYRGNDTLRPVASHNTLAKPSVGEYQCRAKCIIGGTECTFKVIKAFVVEGNQQRSPSENFNQMTGIVIVMTVSVLLMVVMSVVWTFLLLQRLKKRMNNFIAREVRNDLKLRKVSEYDVDDMIGKWDKDLGSIFTFPTCRQKLEGNETHALNTFSRA